MDKTESLKLGASINMLDGFNPSIKYNTDLFSHSGRPALYESRPIINDPDYSAEWGWPVISLHDTAEDLISSLWQVRLRLNHVDNATYNGSGTTAWPVGALMLAGISTKQREKVLEQLSNNVGINLNNSWSYALVRRQRLIGTAIHPCCKTGLMRHVNLNGTLKPETLIALKNLPKLSSDKPDVTKDGAEAYLSFFNTFGTHFTSSVDYGDCLFQIFAYGATEYKQLVNFYETNKNYLSGPTSPSFVQFTVKLNESGYGYTSATGNICIVSGDPELETSVQAGKWYDSTYSLTNSIFTPFLCSTSLNANETFQKIVAVGVEFASLSSFAEYVRIQIWSLIFKGAMYVKYNGGKGVAPCFINSYPYNLNDVYMKSNIIGQNGLLSTIATPNVDLFSELVDLSAISLKAADIVQNFTVFSNALQIKMLDNTIVGIPGSRTATFISYIISTQSGSSRPPTLCFSKSAFADIRTRLICSKFYGGLHVTNDSDDDCLVIVNGLMFEMISSEVSVTADIRVLLPATVLRKYTTDLEFALVAAEARLNFLLSSSMGKAKGKACIALIQEYLIWLGGIAGADSANASIQARALYLAKIASSYQGYGVPIPFLVYDAYKDTVSNVDKILGTITTKIASFLNRIEVRKAEERIINVDEKLNENIISSGKLLVEYIEAQADFEKDLNNQFQSFIRQKEAQVQALGEQARQYSSQLEEQRLKVNELVEAYKEAVIEWQIKEEIKAALDIASNIFALGFSVIIPSSTIIALKGLCKTVQRIQKAVIIFNTVVKTYNSFESLPSDPQKLVDMLQGIGPNDLNLPTALEWDEMKVNMDLTLNSGPNVAAKNVLSAAFSILVLRGKALLEVQNELQRKLSELSADNARLRLHAEQKSRLSQLSIVLEAEPKNLDTAL